MNLDFSSVNPNVLYIGFLVLVILAGVGEYFHIVPPGSTALLIGGVFGGATAHASIAMGARAANTINAVSQAQAQTPQAATAPTPPAGEPVK